MALDKVWVLGQAMRCFASILSGTTVTLWSNFFSHLRDKQTKFHSKCVGSC